LRFWLPPAVCWQRSCFSGKRGAPCFRALVHAQPRYRNEMAGKLCIFAVLVFCCGSAATMAADLMIIDDRRSGDERSLLGASWRLITDGVMGGVSRGRLTTATVAGRPCLRLQGDVRLENRGGFVQAALDVGQDEALDASQYTGVQLEVFGDGETYNVHLRTSDVWLPWQAYRASFHAPAGWHTLRLPFSVFSGYRISSALDLKQLERIAIVAIGREFAADLCLASLALYRDESSTPGLRSR
jgi:hypothetical protein